jgi:hypothetical protein
VRRFLFLLLVPLIPLTQSRIDASPERGPVRDYWLTLWPGEKVKMLSTTFRGVMADIYWLRTVQYYGGQRAYSAHPNFEPLLPLTDITTTLDPRFEIAYRYGAIFLSEAPPHGAGNPQAGLALLAKGVAQNPDSWRLRWDMGTLEFFSLRDPKRAAATLLEAATIQGAPFWLETVAAAMLGEGGERDVARQIWKRMQQDTYGALKDNATYQLRRLDALDEVEAVQRLVSAFRASRGRTPETLEELRAAGLVAQVPTDPSGVPFDYDPRMGLVTIGKASSLWAPSLGGL